MSNWNDLKQIILNNEREQNFVESTRVGGVYLPLAIINNWDVYVFSFNKNIHSIYTYLIYNGVRFKGLIYFDREYENCIYEQTNINEISNPENSLVIIIAGEELTNGHGLKERINLFKKTKKMKKRKYIQNKLAENGINKFVYMEANEILEVFCECDIYYYDEEGEYYKDNINEIKQVYEILEDNTSKDILTEYIRTRIQSGTFSLPVCDGRNKYFYGLQNDELYIHKEDEVWVNCGSAIGDTILMYFAKGYSAKRVYAYEGGNESVYNELKKNIALLPKHLFEKVKLVNCFIANDTNWENEIKEKITLVNADIEGAEVYLINTMKEKLIEDRPVIALCVYHKIEHLIDIPKMLNNLLKDYVFLLRKYPCTVASPRRTSELVLYAIPKERYVCN